MADDTPANVSAIPQDGQLSPILEQAGNAFQTPEGQDFSKPILSDIQQHLNAVNVVDANSAVGQQYAANMGEIKTNLLSMVRSDPTAANLAIGLAPKLIAPMIDASGLSDEHAGAVRDDLTGSLQTEIAHAAVSRMADFHADAAHALMDSLGEHLGDDNAKASLGQYIDTLQAARVADATATSQQMGSQQLRDSAVSAYRYGATLLDPRTEQVSYPPHFLENLVRNPDIMTQDKGPLFAAFGRLQTNGDVHASDPYAVQNVLSNILDPRTNVSHDDIMSHVGNDMKYVDALMLHGMNFQQTPEGTLALRDLSNVLSSAQSGLASAGDRAGNAAYSRFVNWLLPAYRRTGMDGLNPNSDNYLFKTTGLANFKPSAQDAVAPMPVARKPLSAIFGG